MLKFNFDEALVEQGFHVIDNFLDDNYFQALRTFCLSLEDDNQFKAAKVGNQVESQEAFHIRNDKICWLDSYQENQAVAFYLTQLSAIASQLNQSLFLGIAEIEAHFAVYQPASFYKKHVDQFKNTNSRRISTVFYLNSEWQDDFGGELKLYNQNDELIKILSPKPNRFICFNSELPHEVATTKKVRYSIAGWLKSRNSPF
ncbi:MAG: 2OG-Fe(II) oxygenase [Proteobacteria bacterium]|nr:2OG-Fe(II) oxygenase [Pseudomonadota bacterium]